MGILDKKVMKKLDPYLNGGRIPRFLKIGMSTGSNLRRRIMRIGARIMP